MAIESIVIVGSGTAEWMAAATLSRVKSGRNVEITLAGFEQIGMADTLPLAKLRGEIDGIEKSIRYLAGVMPSHGEYLKRYCPAAA